MHECTSVIINSFPLFQQTLFNKGFLIVGDGYGGHPPSNDFFQTTPSKPMPPMGHPSPPPPPPLKNEALHLKNNLPPPIET